MAKLFNQKPKRAQVQRNAFDLSQRQLFTAPAGTILPFYVQETLPGDHWEINPTSFIRTQPLNSAAFARFKQNIEFFFVPMRLLNMHFDQFVVGTKNPVTSYYATGDAFPDLSVFCFTSDNVKAILDRNINFEKDPDNLGTAHLAKDMFGISYNKNIIRLLDMLGYGDFSNHDFDNVSQSYLPFRILAYNKICCDYFINSDYYTPSAILWNQDDYTLGGTGGNWGQAIERFSQLNDIFTLKYALLKRNYYTTVKPSYQSASFLSNVQIQPELDGYSGYLVNGHRPGNFASQPQVAPWVPRFANNDLYNSQSNITATNIRAMFAMDKFYRNAIDAQDGSYRAQIAAHFGENVYRDPTKCIRIGAFDAPLKIDEVISTANTLNSAGGSPVGDIYGRGVSLNMRGSFSYDCNDHGIIMGVVYLSPEPEYSSAAIDKNNLLLRAEEWPQPEFQDLGLSPILTNQLDSRREPDIFGWQVRYASFKTAIDRVHPPFFGFGANNSPLKAWATPIDPTGLFESGATLPFFHVSPFITNSISQVHYNGDPVTDFTMISMDVNAKVVRNLSIQGQPQN